MATITAANFERPTRRESAVAFYQDLYRADSAVTVVAIGTIIARVEAPNLSATQLSNAISAAKVAYRDLDFGD